MSFTKDRKQFSAKRERENLKQKGVFHSNEALALIVKRKLEGQLGDRRFNSVVDFCCGVGNLLAVFDDTIKKIGFDIEQNFINECSKIPNCEARREDFLLLQNEQKFNAIVANPPFGLRDKVLSAEIFSELTWIYPDLPQLSNVLDSAFILKNLDLLSDDGVCVCVGFPGFLYRGQKERDFREWLVSKGWIVSLEFYEDSFFEDTSISIFIAVFDRKKTSKEIEFISGDKRYIASFEEIKKNDFNLSLNRYILPPTDKGVEWEEGEDDLKVNQLLVRKLEAQLKINRTIDQLIGGATAEHLLWLLEEFLKKAKNEQIS